MSAIAATERHAPDSPRLPHLRALLDATRAVENLTDWAEVARALPALDQSEVAAVGAIAARLDARIAGGADA